jgi:hypothetical protein
MSAFGSATHVQYSIGLIFGGLFKQCKVALIVRSVDYMLWSLSTALIVAQHNILQYVKGFARDSKFVSCVKHNQGVRYTFKGIVSRDFGILFLI